MTGGASPTLDDREFRQLRALVHELSGIDLNDNKRALLAGRLSKRLRLLGLRSFGEYHDHVLRDRTGAERVELVNCVTTNKTDFFREPHHFDFLRTRVIPEARARAAAGAPRRLRLWSAGCSTGEEPYSIAMTLRDALRGEDWDVRIVASDIDTEVLAWAAAGIYPEERLGAIPEADRRRHFLRGKGERQGAWRVRPELRSLVDFQHVNLTATRWPFAGGTRFDAIFCRNVVIYFDQPTQRRLAAGFGALLPAGGYLFVGHSESMIGISDAFTLVGQTVHRLEAAEPAHRRLHVGELHASRTPARLSTVLGSCVSACLYDPVARVGGMNHFLLPSSDGGDQTSTRYGGPAMEQLVARILALGGTQRRLQAKVIGANNVMDTLDGAVARENIRFAREWLAAAGIPIVGERLGRLRPTEAHFLTETGQLRCRDVVAAQEPA